MTQNHLKIGITSYCISKKNGYWWVEVGLYNYKVPLFIYVTSDFFFFLSKIISILIRRALRFWIFCRLWFGDSFIIQMVRMCWLPKMPCFLLCCYSIFRDFSGFSHWHQNWKGLLVSLLKLLGLELHTICFGIFL